MSTYLYNGTICKAFSISSNEAKIVELLISRNGLTITEISGNTDINRTTCYKYIRNLKKRGLVKITILNKVKRVYLKDLSNLIFSLKDKYTLEYSSKMSHIDHLSEIHRKIENRDFFFKEPKVDLYEGIDSLKEVYKKTLTADFILAYFNPWKSVENRKIDEWHTRQRELRNIPIKILLPKSTKSSYFSSVQSKLKEMKYLNNFSFTDMKIITDSSVIYYSDVDKVGYCIESKYLCSNEVEIFNSLWGLASK